jgi:hypothetical protein
MTSQGIENEFKVQQNARDIYINHLGSALEKRSVIFSLFYEALDKQYVVQQIFFLLGRK